MSPSPSNKQVSVTLNSGDRGLQEHSTGRWGLCWVSGMVRDFWSNVALLLKDTLLNVLQQPLTQFRAFV